MSNASHRAERSSREARRPATWRAVLARWAGRLVLPFAFLIVGLVLIATLGVAQRMGWMSVEPVVASGGGDASQTYTCPMHPQIRQPGPGRCPICGMALVPATAAAGDDLNELSLRIEPAQRRLANIRTAVVEEKPVTARIETVGELAIDESRMATIAAYIDGRLERLFADYTGVPVSQGDHLAVIYSPELYAAQVEYLESREALGAMTTGALQAVHQAQQKLVANARQKLVELGLRADQIAELESSGEAKSRLTLYAPVGGTVIEKLAVEGKYIQAGDPIYRIADLSTVWLMLELYPEDAAKIRFGQRVEAELQSLPGETFTGRVAFIDPTVDERKRTVGVRVEFLNPEQRLRPGDYASAVIEVPIGGQGRVYDAALAGRWISPMHPQVIRDEPGECPICGMDLVPTTQYGYADQPLAQPTALTVPRGAVLMAGDSSVVYVETEPGRFEIRPVQLGPILRDEVVIVDGVKVGERVATDGNFLIDSQMQLAGKPSLIDPTRAVQKQPERNEPLEFDTIEIASIPGEAGRQLEDLFAAYFAIQQALATDQTPPTEAAQRLHQLANDLADQADLPAAAREELATIAQRSEHLHHEPIESARLDSFRPISHAIVRLATQVRGESASETFHHMFCPMVKGGAGDWLQADDQLLNPYWGSKMLRCGDQVETFPVATRDAAENAESTETSTDSPASDPPASGDASAATEKPDAPAARNDG